MRRAILIPLWWLLGLLLGCSANRVMLSVSTAAIATDCGTTAYALSTGDYHETNMLIGRQPTPTRLWVMCASGAALNAVAPEALGLSKDGKTAWWSVITLIEVLAITHNLRN